jgi:hypothetical protein
MKAKFNAICMAYVMAVGYATNANATDPGGAQYKFGSEEGVLVQVFVPALGGAAKCGFDEIVCPSEFAGRWAYVVPAGATVVAHATLYHGWFGETEGTINTTQPIAPQAIPDYCNDTATGSTTCTIDSVPGQDDGEYYSYKIVLDEPGFYSYKVNFLTPYIYQATGKTRNREYFPYTLEGPLSGSGCIHHPTDYSTMYASECVNILVQ